jgi:SAM-dependent methyltransferase
VRDLRQLDAIAVYEDALRDATAPEGTIGFHAVGDDGSRRPLPLARWLGTPDSTEDALLARARGPVLDIGCGPGRHVTALGRRGIEAVGVEIAPGAIALARRHGAAVIEGSIFEQPLTSNWGTALLLDGNIGIGGDATRLLRRTAALLRPGGLALVELEPPASASRPAQVRLESGRAVSDWIPWAFVGAGEIAAIAAAAELTVGDLWEADGRWFAQLDRGDPGCLAGD